MVFLLVGGLASAFFLPVQLFPKVDLRTISMSVQFLGASPKEIEQDVNRRIEERVIGLRGVKRVVSTAQQGVGRIKIEMHTFADANAVLDEVKSAVDGIAKFPPAGAEAPDIRLIKINYEVLTLAVSSASATEDELRQVAEQLQSELLALPAITHVELYGVRDREITIEIDEEQLRRHNLTLSRIERKIKQESVNLSFGELRTETGGMVLHTISKRETGDAFANIPLLTGLDGTMITLGDIATVTDGFVDRDISSQLNDVPTAFVRVNADEAQSIAKIGNQVKSWLASKPMPSHITIDVWNDRAEPSIKRIGEIIANGIIGIILVFICLVAVFDLRFAIWITVGIPISFIGSLLLFGIADLSLNVGTIFAFFLLVGIVVDDAIVVGESIAAQRARGKDALEAAISGARSMFWPITIGVATTAIAFVPLLFVTAERYQIVTAIPYVAFFVLLISWIEVFLILPAHLSPAKPLSLSPLRRWQNKVGLRIEQLRNQIIGPAIVWAIQRMVLTPVIGLAVVVFAFALLATDTVPVIVNDRDTNTAGSVQTDIYFPPGTPFSVTLATATEIAKAAHLAETSLGGGNVNSVSMVVGLPIMLPRQSIHKSRTDTTHIASVRVNLVEQSKRSISALEFEKAWRQQMGSVPTVEKIHVQSTRNPTRPTIAYSLQHNDRDVLLRAARDLRNMLSIEPAVYGLSDNTTLGKLHFEIELTPEGRAVGLTPLEVGLQLKAAFQGLNVQRIQRGHEELKAIIRYPRDRRDDLNELLTERLRVSKNSEIPFHYIADINDSRELASLTSIDGNQAVFVEGFIDSTLSTPRRVRKKVADTFAPQLLERYPGLSVEPEGSVREERAVLKTMAILVPFALLAMYVLVATFLRSYWKPLVVVFGIPIAFSGAVIAHWIMGWNFSGMSLFGVVGVLGVIVNDALVLLDKYNKTRSSRADLPAIAAASAAMHSRFRAVFLTTLTTMLALSPLLYERSEELLLFVPFVVSILGGLVLASLFTLFLLPNLIMLFEGRRE